MKMNVAICDDEKNEIDNIKNFIINFSINTKYEFICDEYKSGEELLNNYEIGKYDIIFIDMEMGKLSGIETIRKIRSLPDRNVLVIFITNYAGYMQDSFDVQASQYLLKPIKYEMFFEKLSIIMNYIDENSLNIAVFTKQNEEIFLHVSDIMYIQTVKKIGSNSNLLVATIREKIEVKGKIKVFEKMLMKDYFVCSHRTTLVNLKYVKRFTSTEVELVDGTLLPMSRDRASILKKETVSYMALKYLK